MNEDETAQQVSRTDGTHAGYTKNENLAFDPMKELNLPGSYDEVLERFKRLQGTRAMESLN